MQAADGGTESDSAHGPEKLPTLSSRCPAHAGESDECCLGDRIGVRVLPLIPKGKGGESETANAGCWIVTVTLLLGRLPRKEEEKGGKTKSATLVVPHNGKGIAYLFDLYSQTGWGNRLAQLLHGWPWLHYGFITSC